MLTPLLAVLLTFSASLPGPIARHATLQIRDTTVVVQGHRVHALCRGSRQPGVVLLHGAESRGATWKGVLERWDEPIRVCAYDRLGHGKSESASGERAWRALLEELRAIHRALGFTKPAILVGHSLGALYARALAVSAPDDVRGLVLVDPAHEITPDRVRDAMPPDAWRRLEKSLVANSDSIDQRVLGAFLRVAPQPEVPVTVITATRRQDGPGWDPEAINAVAAQLHAALIRGTPAGRHVWAEHSGHNVQRDQPALVLAEIKRLMRTARRNAPPAGFSRDSGTARVNGVELFYRAFGGGEPVIMLHGGPSPASGYLRPAAERLAADFRVLIYDQRGTGRSSFPPDSAMSRQYYVRDLEALRARFGFQRIHLVGHSWGGQIAMAYALQHPARLRSLILIGTTEPGHRYRERFAANLAARRNPADSAALAKLFGSEGFERGDVQTIDRIYRVIYRPWFADPSLTRNLSFGLDRAMAEAGRAAGRLFAQRSSPADYWDELADLTVPTLIVHGARDPVPIEMVGELARILPHGRLMSVQNAGHFPWIERPHLVFPAIRNFLNAN